MVQVITRDWMIKQIGFSNEQAAKNRNLYPIQEQATQGEIWERVPCTCEENCSCKKMGCTHHWKLKKGVKYEDFVFAFLRTFVDRCEHLSILMTLKRREENYPIKRYKEAYSVLRSLEDDWESLSGDAADHNKTLFCHDWDSEGFRTEWQKFDMNRGIYHAKKFCLLLPDICVPYDTSSLTKILKFMEGTASSDYYQLLTNLREKFLESMKEENLKLPELRRMDDPGKYLIFDRRLISLARCDLDYGSGYLPKERQISIVLDKCFYNPKGSSGDE